MKLKLTNLKKGILSMAFLVTGIALSNAQNCPTSGTLTHSTDTVTIEDALDFSNVGFEVRHYKNYPAFDADINIKAVTISAYNPANMVVRVYTYTGVLNAPTLDTTLLTLIATSATVMPTALSNTVIPVQAFIPAGSKIVVEQRKLAGGTGLYVMACNYAGTTSLDKTYICTPSDTSASVPTEYATYGFGTYYMTQVVHYELLKYDGDTLTACFSDLPLTMGNIVLDTTGTYEVTLTNALGCDSVVLLPFVAKEEIVLTGTQLANTITLNQDSATYMWLDCSDNSVITGETDKEFTAISNGTYAAVISIDGCSDTTACFTVTGVGIEDYLLNKTLKVYPNPVISTLNVSYSDLQNNNLQIEIMDLTGRLLIKSVSDNQQKNNSLRMDVSSLSPGIYFLKLNNQIVKFVKQ